MAQNNFKIQCFFNFTNNRMLPLHTWWKKLQSFHFQHQKTAFFCRELLNFSISHKMESFKQLKIHLNQLALLDWDSNRNRKMCAIAAVYSISIFTLVTVTWFLLFTAKKTDSERVEGFINPGLGVLLTTWYTVCIWYREKHVKFFIELDALIGRSKWNLWLISKFTWNVIIFSMNSTQE